MMKTTVTESSRCFAMRLKLTENELFKRIEQLEQEKLQAELVARESLLECETKYQAALDSVDAHITMVDSNLRILWANEKAKEVFGRDIIGKYCCEALYGMNEFCSDDSSCMTRHALRNGSNVNNHSLKMMPKDGADRFFECNARVVSRDENGKPSVVAKVFKDITGQRQVENELRDSMKMLRRNLAGTIQAISRTVETRDAYTAGHQRRTTEIARSIAFEMGLSKKEIEGIRMAGVIHDLGKISVPAEILSKPGKLSEPEFSLIKQHPQTGYDILKGIDFNRPVADIVLQHHERLDGSGYPHKLKGDEILLEARILGVADVIEAMSSHRPYRPALGIDEALQEITGNRGITYDPDVVDASISLFRTKGFQLS